MVNVIHSSLETFNYNDPVAALGIQGIDESGKSGIVWEVGHGTDGLPADGPEPLFPGHGKVQMTCNHLALGASQNSQRVVHHGSMIGFTD